MRKNLFMLPLVVLLALAGGCSTLQNSISSSSDNAQYGKGVSLTPEQQIAEMDAKLTAKLDTQAKKTDAQLKRIEQLTRQALGNQSAVSVSPSFSKTKAWGDLKTPSGQLILGRVEWLWVEPAHDAFKARIDTGATTSSINALNIKSFERDGQRWVSFELNHRGKNDHTKIEARLVRYVRIRQASSEEIDRRPVVRLTIRIGDLTERTEFTLNDRSEMTYPVLVGREFLKDIALVDVSLLYNQPKPQLKKDK